MGYQIIQVGYLIGYPGFKLYKVVMSFRRDTTEHATASSRQNNTAFRSDTLLSLAWIFSYLLSCLYFMDLQLLIILLLSHGLLLLSILLIMYISWIFSYFCIILLVFHESFSFLSSCSYLMAFLLLTVPFCSYRLQYLMDIQLLSYHPALIS